ncbi:hypothetical protein [Limnohabitans planktonicus]|uniref:hypothetical protein n=1 Tax=Limnohabitans planktonicus TaxID=540060 RepID=UPI001057A340|nr:hypothetical protein [Limnohabitans planktonicus]
MKQIAGTALAAQNCSIGSDWHIPSGVLVLASSPITISRHSLFPDFMGSEWVIPCLFFRFIAFFNALIVSIDSTR